MANSDLLPKDVVVNIHDEVSKKVAVSTPGDFLKKGVAKTLGEAFKKMEVSTLSKITTTKGQLNLSKKVAENPQGDAAKQVILDELVNIVVNESNEPLGSNTLFWNCHGAASNEFHLLFKNMACRNRLDVVDLFEPCISGRLVDKDWCFVTVVYASLNASRRKHLWEPLARLDPCEQASCNVNQSFRYLTTWQDHPHFKELLNLE
ncbi:hypothetical protein V6N11_054652 [Hibiscus sabdariffa]|uniref:Uncharacterized protein n=1 Tax=Hibiscus sabdariffa TaxID=183260 RepID=A0ABR2S4K5_9ROSI